MMQSYKNIIGKSTNSRFKYITGLLDPLIYKNDYGL